ncbi:MAG: WecB/TagA/CpsF family glycosyltransferase, partial [Synergistetes bacterium]|nr:WecB/TagA/CpsF family glycosyltransferase [Synergistota bacterium]
MVYILFVLFIFALSFLFTVLPKFGSRSLTSEDREKFMFLKTLFSILLFTSSSLLFVFRFPNLSPVVFSGVLVFLVELVLKAYPTLRSLRLLFLCGIALYLANSGVRIHFLSLPDGGYRYLSSLSIPLTILWFAVVSNSIVILDEIRGAALGVSSIASLVFCIVAYIQDQGLWDAVALSLFVFLFCVALFWFKGDEQLGDELSTMLGFLLASVAILGVLKKTAFLTLLVPILVLAVPIVNMSYALVSGYVHPLSSGVLRSKTLYRYFISLGLGEREISALINLLSLYFAFCAVLIFKYSKPSLVLLSLLGAFVLAKGYVRFVGGKAHLVNLGMRRNILGIRVDNVSLEYALGRMEAFLRDGFSHIIVTPDSPALLTALEDREYREILEKADMVVPDGIGVVIISKLLGQPIRERLPGIELMNASLERAAFYGRKVFLLGSKRGVAERAAKNIELAFPGIKIVGIHHGYFDEAEEKELIEKIRQAKPDYLFVAMGVPKQEKWIYKNRDKLGVPIMMGVGGSLDVWAGDVKRAPLIYRKLCLEWLYRALKEPWRWKKIMKLYKLFWILTLNFLKGSEKRET